MGLPTPNRLRVAAIDFLNPAPLMWDFNHSPLDSALAQRYQVHATKPSQCAIELREGRADLGLIPVAGLTEELAIVPGCAIAAIDEVRSIQLIVKRAGRSFKSHEELLLSVRTVSADTASSSSVAYAQILFRKFLSTRPRFLASPADPITMLQRADAALLIGDPALLALEAREQIEAQPSVGDCVWFDLAHEWHIRTGLPWVAAVWAVQPSALTRAGVSSASLIDDLNGSRDHGLANIDSLVAGWTPRIAIPPATIRHYLTQNIYYSLDEPCLDAIRLFRAYAAEMEILPPLSSLRFL